MIKFTIYGDPRTKKNHMQIIGSGKKCPVCGKPQKQWISQGKAYHDYKMIFLNQAPVLKSPLSEPLNVQCKFFLKTNRRVDLLNLLATTDDLLVESGIILDDNKNIVVSHDGSRVYVDKENPRCEITIEKAN